MNKYYVVNVIERNVTVEDLIPVCFIIFPENDLFVFLVFPGNIKKILPRSILKYVAENYRDIEKITYFKSHKTPMIKKDIGEYLTSRGFMGIKYNIRKYDKKRASIE